MNYFCHISEFNSDGYQSLPTMLFLSKKTVLWSPSIKLLNYEYSKSNTFLSDQDILDLINKRKIQVIGRQDWLIDKKYRNSHPWEWASWENDFDNQIRSYAIDDVSLPESERRVKIVNDEKGYLFADEVMNSTTQPNKEKVKIVEKLIHERKLPIGTIEKIGKQKDIDQKKRIVLRDVFNHKEAFADSKAEYSLEYDNWITTMISLLTDDIRIQQKKDQFVATEKIIDLIEFLNKINKPKTYEELKEVLKNADTYRKEINSDFYNLINSDIPIRSILDNDIWNAKDAPKLRKILKEAKIKDYISLGCFLGSFATLSIDFFPIILLLSGVSLEVFSKETIVRNILESKSILSNNKSEYKLPYVWALGKSNPKYNEIKQLYIQINE